MLSFVFFASIAAGADIAAMLEVAPLLVLFVLILLATHLSCLLVVGRWLKLTLPELLTASNAGVLGATTAPAMAAAKGWHDVTRCTGGGIGLCIGHADRQSAFQSALGNGPLPPACLAAALPSRQRVALPHGGDRPTLWRRHHDPR